MRRTAQMNQPTPVKNPQEETAVYHAVRPRVVLTEHELYVPRFMSPEFFRFIGNFLAHPGENPVFLREWRRNRRRLGPFEKHWIGLAASASFVFALLGVGASLALRAASGTGVQVAILLVLFFVPMLMAGLYGLFSCIQGSPDLQNQRNLEELALTPLRPQEIAFGNLIGGILPLSFIALPMLPGYLIVALDASVIHPVDPNLGLVFGVGYVLWFFPNIATSMISSASISSAVTYAQPDYSKAVIQALSCWAVIGLALVYPFLAVTIPMAQFTGASVLFYFVPCWVLLRLVVIGGFLHHTAVRLARARMD